MWTGVWPFDLASFFGSADNPDFVLLRVTPTTASVLFNEGGGITRRTWQR
jgi:general stress protein 26